VPRVKIEVGSTWMTDTSDSVWTVTLAEGEIIDLARGIRLAAGTRYDRRKFLTEVRAGRWWRVPRVKLEVGSVWSCDDKNRPEFHWTVDRLDKTTVYMGSPRARTEVNRHQFMQDVKEGKMWQVAPSEKRPTTFNLMIPAQVAEVAEAAACLHYESLAIFLERLADRLDDDSNADNERGRLKLSKKLFEASLSIRDASAHISVASRIKPKKGKHRGKEA
jgi:hypothetical protein